MQARAARAESPYASIRDAFERLFSIPDHASFDELHRLEEERCRKRVEAAFRSWARRRK